MYRAHGFNDFTLYPSLLFCRPEIKFESLDKLLTQIQRDIGIAKSCLIDADLAKYANEL